MARWRNIESKGNIEDRRGFGPIAGGIGITGILGILALNFLFGGDIGDALQIISEVPIEQQDAQVFEGEDEYEAFASRVVGSADAMWREKFRELEEEYTEARLVLFRGSTDSQCGGANSAVGPHYCPLDSTIYLDETFFDELARRFGASGDVAQAYVIAHEVGHHAQLVMGSLGDRGRRDSIAIELQADCFSGLWAHSLKDENVFEEGEIREAMDAAAAVGDDRIQQETTGRVDPENWTHGSSEDRLQSFMTGYVSGELSSCM